MVAVIGTDCTGQYLCIDPQKKGLIKYDLSVLQFKCYLYQILK